jgi:multidrug efflux pump subunit AcrB
MLQPLAITVIGGLLSSMVLSLVFTPAINYFLRRDATLESAPVEVV